MKKMSTNRDTTMYKVLQQVMVGVNDRAAIAEAIGCSEVQVRAAFNNLYSRRVIEVERHVTAGQKGRMCSVYRVAASKLPETRNPVIGVSSIFNAGANV